MTTTLVAIVAVLGAVLAGSQHGFAEASFADSHKTINFPGGTVVDAGSSLRGRAINLFRVPARDTQGYVVTAKYRFLIQGGIHGNEKLTTVFVKWLAARYADGQSVLNGLPRNEVEFDFLPEANPDGLARNQRHNDRGVDLNRNYGVLWGQTRTNPGDHPFSEPETMAIGRLMTERSYTAAVDVHGFVNWIVAPSETILENKDMNNEQKSGYASWIMTLKGELARMPGYKLLTGSELGDGGAFEDWAYWKLRTFAFCLEMNNQERYVTNHREALTAKAPTDTFLQYEGFIHRMFQHAIELRKQNNTKSDLIVEGHPRFITPLAIPSR